MQMPKLMGPLIATAMLAGALLSAPALAAQNFNPEDYVGTARIVGQVVDAQTGTPLMGARVSIPGLEKHSVTNRDGRFLLADLALGRYSVAVEQLGFSIWQDVLVATASGLPAVLRMAPDPILLTGLEVSADRFQERIRSAPVRAKVIDSEALAEHDGFPLADLLTYRANLFLGFCSKTVMIGPKIACEAEWHEHGYAMHPTNPYDDRCVRGRGRPNVYLDEAPLIGGLARLEQYPLDLLYRIEVYDGIHIRAYTRDFMRRSAGVHLGALPFFH